MTFRLQPLRFTFIARESIHFAEGKSANMLRGAFGTIFRRIACVPQCTAVRECELRASCPYSRMFEPFAMTRGPSGLADWPRPFVFRATHLGGLTIAAGQRFYFDLNLFDTATPPAVQYLVLAFAQLAREGLGPGRRKVDLLSVGQLDECGRPSAVLYESETGTVRQNVPPLELDLSARPDPVHRVRVRFITPTELKSGQEIVESAKGTAACHQTAKEPASSSGGTPSAQPVSGVVRDSEETVPVLREFLSSRPEFGILAARIRDRISTLRELYGPGPLEMDFRAFRDRANRVRMAHCDLRKVEVFRRSSRTGQVHPVGGFIGEAEYEGDLTEFVPYLKAAKWTGVGRQTVWGKGEIDVVAPNSPQLNECCASFTGS